MTLKTLATASCLSMAMATGAFAAPVDFTFSFTDGINTITGLIEGLDSDGIGQAASKITVDGVLETYVITAPGGTFVNSFDVFGSVIFVNTVVFSGSGDFVRGFDGLDFGALEFSGAESLFQSREFALSSGDFPITQARSVTFTPVSAVPLPAGGLLLLSGLGGVAALQRRKKRAA